MTETAQLDRIEWSVWRIAIITASGAFLSSIDASVVAVGLDTIGADLHTDLAQVQWVSSIYLIGVAVAMPLSGWLAGRLGAGRLWIWMMAAFTLLSVFCALAPTVETLIAARAAQGFAGGMLIPAGQTLIGQAVGSNRLGRVMGTLGVVVSLGGAAGPTLGGFVLDNLSWPWLFWINLPIGVLAVVLGHRYVPRGATVPVTRFDWRGFALAGAGLPLVIYGLTAWGERTSLTTTVAGSVILGFAAILAFGAHSLRRTDPLLDLRSRGLPGLTEGHTVDRSRVSERPSTQREACVERPQRVDHDLPVGVGDGRVTIEVGWPVAVRSEAPVGLDAQRVGRSSSGGVRGSPLHVAHPVVARPGVGGRAALSRAVRCRMQVRSIDRFAPLLLLEHV